MGKQWWEDEDGLQFWREEQVLVMRRNAEIPCERCVKCNATASGAPVRIALSWSGETPPAWLRGAPRGYFEAVSALTQARAVVYVGLCARHRRERKRWLLIVGAVVLVAMGLFAIAAMTPHHWIFLIGLLLIGLGAAGAARGVRLLNPEFINDDFVCVSGIGTEYLAQVPRRV